MCSRTHWLYEDVFHGKAVGEPVRISIRAAHPDVGVSTLSRMSDRDMASCGQAYDLWKARQCREPPRQNNLGSIPVTLKD